MTHHHLLKIKTIEKKEKEKTLQKGLKKSFYFGILSWLRKINTPCGCSSMAERGLPKAKA